VPIFFPQTQSAKEGVFVFAAFDALGQSLQSVHVSAAEHDIVRDERFLELSDGKDDLAFPPSGAEPFESRNAEKVFDDVSITLG